jgi:hypothetical protein
MYLLDVSSEFSNLYKKNENKKNKNEESIPIIIKVHALSINIIITICYFLYFYTKLIEATTSS